MPKRFVALLITLLLIIPTVFTAVGATEPAQNPFEYNDNLRQAVLQGSVDENAKIAYSLSQKSAASSAVPSENGGTVYIVRFTSETSLTDIYDIVKGYNYKLLANSGVRLFSIVLYNYESFVNQYRDNIDYIEEVIHRQTAAVTNDPLLSDSWEYKKMNIFNAWNFTSGKSSVIVAVLDTGIERSHEDFAGTRILPGFDTVTQRALVTNDSSGHGTMVSGLIAATGNNRRGSAGVAYGATILPIRVSSTETSISSEDLVFGIYFAADAGAKVINMSLGGYSSSFAEEDAIRFALNKGCILVASSGNDGAYNYGGDAVYPASYDGVISVGSIGEDGSVSSFSQYNEYVDVVAPGEKITVMVYQNGVSEYKHYKGTSFSAAFVSAIAALAASHLDSKVSFGTSEFRSLIKTTGGKRNNYYGHGVIDAVKILELVNLPIVSGVSDGETYSEMVTVKFNRGSATLDGEAIFNNEFEVIENGPHTLVITYGAYKRTIKFTVDNKPLTYNYKLESNYAVFTFSRGTATLNGFPYASGRHITASGEHIFVLSGAYSNTVTRTVTLSFDLPHVVGVSDGGSYDTAVCIRVIGNGTAVLNGVGFTRQTVIGTDGNHTLVVSNSTKSKSKTYSFKIESKTSVTYKADLVNARAIVDAENGYVVLYSELLNGIRVYDINNPTVYKRYLSIGKVNGYALYGAYLLIFHENTVTRLDRSRVLNQSNPVDGVINVGESIAACTVIGNDLYYVNQMSLKRLSLATQQKSVVAQLSMGANTAFLSESGEYIYLFNTSDNGKNCIIYDIAASSAYIAEMPLSAVGKRILYGNGKFVIGNSVISENGFALLGENSSERPVSLSQNLLFTNNFIINTDTNQVSAIFRDEINDIFIGADNRTFVFYKDGSVDIINNAASPITDFSPSRFKAAVIKDTISAGGTEESAYSSFARILSERSIISFAQYGSRQFLLCENVPVLYVIDAVTLVQVDEIPLLFMPRQVFVLGERVFVSFKNAGAVYSAQAALVGFGNYLNIGFIPSDLVITDNKLVSIRDNKVVVVDLISLITTDTGITASNAYAVNNTIYVSNGSSLIMYDLSTYALKGSISSGIVIASFKISGDYAFIGGRVFGITSRSMLFNTDSVILAHRENTLLTAKGVFDLSSGMQISSFTRTGLFYYIDESFNYYIVSADKIVRMKSANGSCLTEKPDISDLKEDEGYTDGVVISFSYGIGYIGTNQISSGTGFTEGGEHTFTLVLSCGISLQIKFYILPALEGIGILGGDKHMNVNETITIKVQFLPAGASSVEVVFERKDTDIIMVDQHGTVTALKTGVATVRALTLHGAFYDECIITVSEFLIRFDSSTPYKVDRDNRLVIGVGVGTFATEIISALNVDGSAEILDQNGNKADGVVGTGMVLVLKNNNDDEIDRLLFSVKGDINGDGYLSAEDLYCLIEILENIGSYDTAYMKAADINGNGRVANGDMTALRAQLMYFSDNVQIKRTPPVINTTNINALLNTRIFNGEKVVVTLQLDGARGVYAVNGRLYFNKELLEYVRFIGQNWNDTVHMGDGFISFLSYDTGRNGSDRSSKTLLVLEFALKEGALGQQLLFEVADIIAVNGGVSNSLSKTQTLRTVQQRIEGDFNIKINNTKDFVFSKDIYDYKITVEHNVAVVDIEVEYPNGASVVISDTIIPENDKLSIRIIYIDTDSKSYNYYINVTREKEYIPSSNCFLKSLTVVGYELSPLFDRDIINYSVTVPFPVDILSLSFIPECDLSHIEVSDTTLEVGINIVTITCTAENGDIKVYTVSVIREESDSSEEELSDVSADTDTKNKKPFYIVMVIMPLLATAMIAFTLKRKYYKKQTDN